MTDESLVLLVEDLLEFLNSMKAAITLFKGQIDKNFGLNRETFKNGLAVGRKKRG
jgi:hypothetical protein